MKTVWILFFVSTGYYNGGTVSSYDAPFPSKEACQAVVAQLYAAEDGLAGRATAICVEVAK